ncbi:MAG: D-sedoheptulose-7-phosphate isomerase [Thermoguttaceae bacterium]
MLGFTLGIEDYLARLRAELQRVDPSDVRRLADLLYEAWEGQQFVFLFGNGGSATTASHLAEDLAKNSVRAEDLSNGSGKRLKVLSLTDNIGWITALANDLSYEQVFLQQLAQYGRPGDLAIAISGSGNSPNVVAAVDWANRHGLMSFGMTGFDGGRLKRLQQAGIHVALDDMAMVESIHMCVAHWVVDDLAARIRGAGRYQKPALGAGP